MNRRVVITGIGLVSALGLGTRETWAAVLAGQSGVTRVTRFDVSGYAAQIAAEVKGFDPLDWIEKKDIKKMDLFIQYAIAAAQFAMDDSTLTITPENARMSVPSSGLASAGSSPSNGSTKRCSKAGRGKCRRSSFRPRSSTWRPARCRSDSVPRVRTWRRARPVQRPRTPSANPTRSSSAATRTAMIAGGSEAAITPMSLGGFAQLRALSTRNDDPGRASRPFDKDRDGFIIGEGAGMLILEELEFATRRGARIYAEIVGYGSTSDAYHMTAPSEDGDGARRAMVMAIRKAGITPDQVDYINAHGTSTPYNDKLETLAIKNCFGEHARTLAISSTKSMTGHLLGGAGGLEAGISALSVFHDEVPPTINLDNPDPECDLDYVPHQSRKMPVRYALSNSFGFGGTNAALLFKKVRSDGMKIAVCIKQVPTREWQPRLTDDKTWIREQDASFEMNEPDAYALEEALRLREKHSGEVVVCAAGPARVQQVIREALARGADRALHVEDDRLASADASVTADALAAAMMDERFDLVLTGLQSDDLGQAQTGVVLAERLGIPHSTIIMEVQVRWDLAARQARARRRLVPVDRHAAAGAADHSERHQSAALRDVEGHHGG